MSEPLSAEVGCGLVIASNDALFATRTAQELGAREALLGRSAKSLPEFQAESFAIRRGRSSPTMIPRSTVRIISEREELYFAI